MFNVTTNHCVPALVQSHCKQQCNQYAFKFLQISIELYASSWGFTAPDRRGSHDAKDIAQYKFYTVTS